MARTRADDRSGGEQAPRRAGGLRKYPTFGNARALFAAADPRWPAAAADMAATASGTDAAQWMRPRRPERAAAGWPDLRGKTDNIGSPDSVTGIQRPAITLGRAHFASSGLILTNWPRSTGWARLFPV
jgi:hypothetical protein